MEKVNDPTIPDRINTLLGSGVLNSWETDFLNSVAGSYKKFDSLTRGQYNTLVDIETRHGPDAKAAHAAWLASWNEQKADTFKKVMGYYAGTGYYAGIVKRWRENPQYIPTQKEYTAVCENKYSTRLLEALNTPPKFAVGDLVVIKYYSQHRLALVTYVSDKCDWSKGSREYIVDLVGSHSGHACREKDLKGNTKRYLDKIKVNEDIPF